MLTKIILWVTGIGFASYGIACLFSPELAAGYIGYEITNADTFIEASAMYGGLQLGMGIFCILGVLVPAYTRASLMAIAIVIGSLALGRIIGLTHTFGDPTAYSYGAIVYEALTTLIAIICLRSNSTS